MSFGDHPCFSENARHTTGRIHLPVAPKCNIQCNFCDRKFDCVNESRPGVASRILLPRDAVDYLGMVLERIPSIAVAGIAGPGDPLANADETLETFRLVKGRFPRLHLCMATNGLELPDYADDIAAIGIDHVTVTVNAADAEIAAKIYSWVRYNKRPYRGAEGAEILLARQLEGIAKLKKLGTTVKINTVVIPGINESSIAEIARKTSELGADVQNCIPLYHVKGTAFENLQPLDPAVMKRVRSEAGNYIRQMTHCQRCRADAAGMLGEQNSELINELLAEASNGGKRIYVAAASMEGLFVNQHLGEASGLWIFSYKNGSSELVDRRSMPSRGGGVERWNEVARILSDCRAVLVSGIGNSPARVLENSGVRVIAMEGLISDGVNALFTTGDVPAVLHRKTGVCGAGMSCGGTGTGCG